MATKEEAAAKKAEKEAKAAAKKAVKQDTAPVEAIGIYAGKELVRVFSLKVHGDEYVELANALVARYPDRGYVARPYTLPAPTAIAEDTEKVHVINPSGDVIRTFSRAKHGDDYRELAEAVVKQYPKRKYSLK